MTVGNFGKSHTVLTPDVGLHPYLEDMDKGRVPGRVSFLDPLWNSGLYFVNNFCLATEEPQSLILFHLSCRSWTDLG